MFFKTFSRRIPSFSELYKSNPDRFQLIINTQRYLRDIDQLHLINGEGNLILSAADIKYKKIEDRAMKMVKNDDRPLKIINTFENKSAAVLRLSNFDNTFLYVLKYFDKDISNYLIESEEAVKLSMKSFNLLDDALNIKPISDLDLKKIKNINYTIYHLNTFNFSSIFNLKNSIKPSLIVLVVVFSFYVIALLNINSNYSQINKMNTTLETIYNAIYPTEKITDIYQQIDVKLNSLNNEEATALSTTITLLKNLSETTNVMEADFSQNDLQIKFLFKNDAEESIFMNQQNRLNYDFKIVDSKVTQIGKITTVSYEL